MATEPVYEVYALKYGERDTTKCQFFYREGSHDKLTLHYFVWLILGRPAPGPRRHRIPRGRRRRRADPRLRESRHAWWSGWA